MADRAYSVHNGHSTYVSQNTGFFRKPNFEIDFIAANSNYDRALDLIAEGRKLGITRKWIRLCIRNIGGEDANNCHVQLNVHETAFNNHKRHPTETVDLCWANLNATYTTIGRKDQRYIELVFADSDFSQTDRDVSALISTPELVNTVGQRPMQFAFGADDFEIDVTVVGTGVTKTHRVALHVDEQFDRTTVKPFNTETTRFQYKLKQKLKVKLFTKQHTMVTGPLTRKQKFLNWFMADGNPSRFS